jgi:PKHD-type hydroxylase
MSLQISFGDDRTGRLIFPPSCTRNSQQDEILGAIKINGHVSAPLIFTGIFSPEECTRICEFALCQRQRVGAMMYARQNIRKSVIAWIGVRNETEWLYAKIWHTFEAVNRWFDFDLLGLVDEIQFATYATGDSFDWHLDTGGGQTSTRKLSMSVQLSEESTYAGGDLEFCACSQLEFRRRQGTIIVFPSFLGHRITPVRSGVRRSLVAWAHGPVFK